jgi:CheY-like chemotaxis protein
VLIVEDEILIRLAIADHFREEGVDVIEAKNGEEALSILRSATPVDLVISDIRMPGKIDGVALAQTAKREYRLPIILVSSHFSEALSPEVADSFFAKPYDLDRILAATVELLKGVPS